MAKKSRKRLGRYEKNQSGCMWSLINIFDFRQGRPSQKLLSDRKRGSKRIVEAAYPDIKLELLGDTCEICKEVDDPVQNGMPTTDASKMSVKELMEEEMCGEQDQKRRESIANRDGKQAAAGDGGHGKRNTRRTRSKASLDLDAYGFVATEGLAAEKPCHRKHKSLSSVDLSVMVEAFCTQIHQKDTSLKHGQDGERAFQPIEDPSVVEEKLWEAIKTLMNHVAEGKSFPKDRKVQPSKELVDALQILETNKEIFLKFLQDPNSQLAKHVQNLQDIQVEEGKFKILIGSYMLEQDLGNVKQQSSFWRRFKGPERISKRNESFEDLSRIVVLKPGPPGSRNLDMDTPCSSLPGSPQSVRDKLQSERGSLTFSFSEFKKKLKHAMRKEQGRVHLDGMSFQPDDQPNMANRDKKVGGENVGIASPSRDHFFIEKLPKFSVGVKKVDKPGKPKDGKMQQEHGTAVSPDQRVSNIYAEAKKYLAEIVGNGGLEMGTPGRQVPKPLGRILSYSGYSSPSLCSPRKQEEMRLSLSEECQTDDKTCQVMEENNVSFLGQVRQDIENEPCIAPDKPIHGAKVSTMELHNAGGPHCEQSVIHEPHLSTSEVDEDIIRSPHAKSQKESDLVESSSKPCPLQPTDINEQDIHDKNESSCSSIESSLICSMTEKNEDVDVMSDTTSRPSPISVLEPIFDEDDISPSGIKSLTAVQPIQPRQLHFEDEISAHAGQVCFDRTCIESDKYTFEFVKAVVRMSGLTWDELLMRSLFSDHLIDPSLIDEVDFLPDLLSCDFNLLFDLINEVLVEISCVNFSCMLSSAKPSFKPELKGKDIFGEIWKGVEWYLKLEGPPRTLDQVVTKDLAKAGMWMNVQPDRDCIGIQVQEAILNDLVEDTILSCITGSSEREFPILPPVEEKESAINMDDE